MSSRLSARPRALALALSAALAAAVPVALPLAAAAPAAAVAGHYTGSTSNGAYVLDVPASFNGTVVLWSHGYSFTPVTAAADAPTAAVRDALLAQGYALAGSTYARGGAGWAVDEGVAAGVELIGLAKAKAGAAQVKRIYVWGASLGGLITQTLAERYPGLVDGVAPLCGVLGGTDLNLDLALDAAVAVKTFFAPTLKLTGYTSPADAQANLTLATTAISKALAANPTGTAPRLVALAALLGAPAQTRDFAGKTLPSATAAAVETIQTALTYGTLGRYDIERRVGGNPSTNVGVDYRHRVTADVVARFTAFGFTPALLRAYAQTLQTYAPRVRASAVARVRADRLGNPTGRLADRTITMHTQYDPLVVVQNERVFADRVRAAGRTELLHQVYVVPPTHPEGSPSVADDGAPYGAGHCTFATSNYTGVLSALDGWVRTGGYTAPATTDGLVLTLPVPAWPAR